MGSRKRQTVGYRYFFGVHMGIGRAIDELVAIRVGDRIAWSGSVTGNTSIQIDAPELFGGDEREGGIQGRLDVMFGAPTQPKNALLAAMLGGLVPAFRGFAGLFFDGLMCSGAPYPKPWALRVRRALNGWDGEPWYPERAVIWMADGQIRAMNPAHLLYECWTNGDWGRGLPRATMADAAWRSAADALHAEGFGLCLEWSRQDALESFMQGVLDHIGAACYVHPVSGLIELRLIRDDYEVAALPLFGPDTGLLSIDEDEASATAAATNELVVRFTSPIDGKPRQVRVKNAAGINAAGSVSSTTKDYPGLPTAELALRVAQRDLRAASGHLQRFRCRLDRRAYELLPGSPFRISHPARGIGEIVLRVGRIEYGTLTDGTITAVGVQDVFGLRATSYVDVQPGGWTPPNTTPAPITDGRLLEVPYRDLAASLDAYAVDNLASSSAYVAAAGGAPSATTLGFELRTRVGTSGAFTRAGEGPCCPTARLAADITAADTALALVGDSNLDQVEVGTAALLGDEIVRVDAIDPVTGTASVGRGCADTVPVPHAADAVILFYEDRVAVDVEYSAGVTLQAKMLTRTSAGLLAEGAANTLTLELVGRQGRPYPPADLRIDGVRYPAEVAAKVLTVAWRHRDRVVQGDQLIDTLGGDIGPESGTRYDVALLKASDASVVQQWMDLAMTTVTLTSVPSDEYLLEVTSRRGALGSVQQARHSFEFTQTGDPQIVEIELGGTFAAGPTFYVDLAGMRFQHTAGSGDADLDGVAAALAAVIDASPLYTAAAAGRTITVAGAAGVAYTVATGVLAGTAAVTISTVQAATGALPQVSQATLSGPVDAASEWSLTVTFVRLGTSAMNRRRYSHVAAGGETLHDVATGIAGAIAGLHPDFVVSDWATRPFSLGGALRAVQSDIAPIMWPDRSGLDRHRLASSIDGGVTWTDDYVGATWGALPRGVRAFDAVLGSVRLSIGRAPSPAEPVTVRQVGVAAPMLHAGLPSASGVQVHPGALYADEDAAVFRLVGRPVDGSGSAPSGMYLYTSADGLAWTLAGALVVDGSDPHFVAPPAASSFVATWFIDSLVAELTRLDGRWFLQSARGLYYTDDAVPLAGWRRCAVGIDEHAGAPGFYAIYGLAMIGSSLVVTSANPLGDCIAVSTDMGESWAIQRPAELAVPFSSRGSVAFGDRIVVQTSDNSGARLLSAEAPFDDWSVHDVVGLGAHLDNVLLYGLGGPNLLALDAFGRLHWSDDAETFAPAEFPRRGPAAHLNPDFAASVTGAVITLAGVAAQSFELVGQATSSTASTIVHRVIQAV